MEDKILKFMTEVLKLAEENNLKIKSTEFIRNPLREVNSAMQPKPLLKLEFKYVGDR